MEQEGFGREMLRLYYGGECEVTAMERVELILPCPEIIRVPGAPDNLVGMIYKEGGLIPVFRPGNDQKPVNDQITGKNQNLAPEEAPACVVLIRKEDGSLKGMAADEVAGGGAIDTVYE